VADLRFAHTQMYKYQLRFSSSTDECHPVGRTGATGLTV